MSLSSLSRLNSPRRRWAGRIAVLLLAATGCFGALPAGELRPLSTVAPAGPEGPQIGIWSPSTIVVGLEVDRDRVRRVGSARKARPYTGPLTAPTPRGFVDARSIQLEVLMSDGAGTTFTRRLEIGPLCLLHGADAEAHVSGDTILLHRDSFLVELPAIAGLDRLEVAYYELNLGRTERRVLGHETLEAGTSLTGPPASGGRLAVRPGESAASPVASPAASTVLWPEDFADPDIYRIYGNAAESTERINVVLVPDGYLYSEKALMESHADAMVAHFRNKTPYKEHDPFMNYTLVYAYSPESGTDECDCGVVVETAMGTRFPEAVAECGNSSNRCLYYGGGCDSSGTNNIVAAELRAPVHDVTIVMVNTPRYGGCGGSRAVYSAGNVAAAEIAVHELGHTLGGLADEYVSNGGCGGFAGEVNTSLDAVNGAWTEWIGDLGPPVQGGQYYASCIYRPTPNCEMRALDQPFCPVCNQQWSLITFGHPRVNPSSPVRSRTPDDPVTAYVGLPVAFNVQTRLSDGAVDAFEWTLSGPGVADDTLVSSDPAGHTHTFTEVGDYSLVYRVTADTDFVKPERYGANQQRVTWNVHVEALAPPGEVSAAGTSTPLVFSAPDTLVWDDAPHAGAVTFNLYEGSVDALGAGSYGSCSQPGLTVGTATVGTTPPAASGWFYLVTGVNPAGEGPLGPTSTGAPRPNASPCRAP